VVGLSSEAAAIALDTSKDPATAVELLETGRSIVIAALFEQANVSTLENKYAGLVHEFIELRNQFFAPVSIGS
jgi:hypothetical protein